MFNLAFAAVDGVPAQARDTGQQSNAAITLLNRQHAVDCSVLLGDGAVRMATACFAITAMDAAASRPGHRYLTPLGTECDQLYHKLFKLLPDKDQACSGCSYSLVLRSVL